MTATLSYSAHCLSACGWTTTGDNSDEEARRHVGELKGGPGHPVAVEAVVGLSADREQES